MKKLENFLKNCPSYTKWGNERLAETVGISVNTVAKFKKTETFRSLRSRYL